MCCLDPKYDKINSSIDSPVYVSGYVDSPQFSWCCTVFALARRYCECDCMLPNSFDLLTKPPEKRLGTRGEAKRLCQDCISFSLQLKTKTLGHSHVFYLKHVDYIILFVLAALGRWILRSNLPFVLSLSIRNDILLRAQFKPLFTKQHLSGHSVANYSSLISVRKWQCCSGPVYYFP